MKICQTKYLVAPPKPDKSPYRFKDKFDVNDAVFSFVRQWSITPGVKHHNVTPTSLSSMWNCSYATTASLI